MSAVPALSFDHVGMAFPDGTHAVDDVSFEVDRGEFVTVVGPSGCGKSTLLKIASGLLDATVGARRHRPRAHRLRVPGSDADAVAHGPGQRRAARRAARTAEGRTPGARPHAIDLVGLTGFEEHYPKSLSGGMRMRCSLARTLTLKPPILMFDEPFGAVDEITREHLNEETLRLFEQEGFAGLFITHSISEAVFMSTRVLVMSARPGHIVAEHAVPFPYPRDPSLRFDPEFAALSGEISTALRAAHV